MSERKPSARLGRRLAVLTVGLGLIGLGLPTTALAHGIVGRADLPIPSWLFAWTAALVMVISFVALFRLWSKPRGRTPSQLLLRTPQFLEWFCGAIGLFLFAAVVVAGLWGAQNFTSNLAPTFIYVIFWVGIPITSAFFGDIFRPFNPWRAVARFAAGSLHLVGPRPGPLLGYYPKRLGRWPAAVTLACFAWLELVYPSKDDPHLLAILALAYGALQLIGMAFYGIETWTSRADGFSVYFGFIATLAPLHWTKGRLYLRWPLLGARDIDILPGTAAVLYVLIGSTSFDGFSNGELWYAIAPPMQSFFERLGFTAIGGYEVEGTIGLIFWILFVACIYNLGIWGMSRAIGVSRRALSGEFLHTLLPIAFGYMLAHYFSLLVLQGQAMGYLISDPLGQGKDFFGTSNFLINYNLISFAAIWYVQILAIIAGHVGGLVLSHDRGLVSFRSPQDSIRAQHWMLIVMVGFTCLALWILSAVTTTTG
ncbi:MAG: fenitrothion hydrolase [Solirubrobacterales bacterium]